MKIFEIKKNMDILNPTEIGIQINDPRLKSSNNGKFIKNIQNKNFVIPNWPNFVKDIESIYQTTKTNTSGKVASYIPQLAKVNPSFYGISICTIDGQILEIGDTNIFFSIQSCSKPITYGISVEDNSEQYVHNFVGREPSGRNFNELCLNHENIPHNPLINSGSIMCVSLIEYKKSQAERFEHIMDYWSKLIGIERIGFSLSTYLSEKNSADRNFTLAYMMQEKKAFQKGKNEEFTRIWNHDDLKNNLELYFQCCSIELNCKQMAMIASTLANGGICPFTSEKVFNNNNVKNILSLIYSCGMYDYSGEWAYIVGIPAKSGVSGIIFAVIPNVMGIAVYSPPLDDNGNSVRGIDFFKKFVEVFNFHTFDSLVVNNKKHITKYNKYEETFNTYLLLEASNKNDILIIKKLIEKGININSTDYDKRTALHIATSSNNLEIVKFLVDNNADMELRDRWNNRPIDDAIREKFTDIIEFFTELKTNKKD